MDDGLQVIGRERGVQCFEHLVIDGPVGLAQGAGDAVVHAGHAQADAADEVSADACHQHPLSVALVLVDGVDDGAREALVCGAPRPQGAALPERRQAQQVQHRGAKFRTAQCFRRLGGVLGSSG